MENTDQICIVDVGSTTTKSVLLLRNGDKWTLAGMDKYPTTVEQPMNDVKIGLLQAIKSLETNTGTKILAKDSSVDNLSLNTNTQLLCTSSAGGGLQILVIGLTLADSASSAKRASYGAGGVILDTFAIDDNRNNIEQMLAMQKLHPDMILLCGGTDYGAISGVLRLAEIIRIANPQPKYDSDTKLPMIYAGNVAAEELIKRIVSESFDLHIMPNLRPSLQTENLKPTQDLIQKLFMENVMEHAPGYKELKKLVVSDILPTPLGVMNSIQNLTIDEARNIFAFDIGGATTDVFSYINSHYQRTVSANLGMSYSSLNVLKEAGLSHIMDWLPDYISEAEVRNYIGNKTLNPTSIPKRDKEQWIEHSLAKEALRLSLHQHREMHYNTAKIGLLDNLKLASREKFELQFCYEAYDATFRFYPSDIDVVLGAGGVFSHSTSNQAMMMLIDGIQPKGITEVWIDKHFITPHLGVLSGIDGDIARQVLLQDCVERLALHISPLYKQKKKSYKLMQVEVIENGISTHHDIMSQSFYYFQKPESDRQIKLKAVKDVHFHKNFKEYELTSDLPLVIDTREKKTHHLLEINDKLGLYIQDKEPLEYKSATELPALTRKLHQKTVRLPYKGETLVVVNQKVSPDEIVALNKHNPPRLYVVNAYVNMSSIPTELLSDAITVRVGQEIEVNDVILHVDPRLCKEYRIRSGTFESPVRGRIEFINDKTGLLVLSEIQDYATKAVTINVADPLSVPPKKMMTYMKKEVGDFVYKGELLARRMTPTKNSSVPAIVRVPATGNIKAIDSTTGTVTIKYEKEATNYLSHVQGRVIKVEPNHSVTIEYQAKSVYGSIGFGQETHGVLEILHAKDDQYQLDLADKVVFCAFEIDSRVMKSLAGLKIKALIVNTLAESDLVEFLGKEPGLINTGNESLPYSLLILGGFGKMQGSQVYAGLFGGLQGKIVYLDPHTRIRAGVIRPYLSVIEQD